MIGINSNLKEANTTLLAGKKKDELVVLKSSLNKAFEQVKEQFEDHLESINENTNEIQGNFEYLCELDRKIDKLSEQVEQLNMLIRKQQGLDTEEKKFELKPLTKKEKEVFYALYILTEHKKCTTYREIARRTCFSENLVASYITSLIEKGIPVGKKYAHKTACLSLDACFRELQAKENIVGVNTLLTHWVK